MFFSARLLNSTSVVFLKHEGVSISGKVILGVSCCVSRSAIYRTSANECKGGVSGADVEFTKRGRKLTFLENLSWLLRLFEQAGKHSLYW